MGGSARPEAAARVHGNIAPGCGVPSMSRDPGDDSWGCPMSETTVDVVDPADPRTMIEFSVLLPNGRLAGRKFASRADAEAWARPDEGDRVVEYNLVCECAV